ncbi:MAG: hypothetical protein HY964_10050 [Ignavibacteriales bacterium]|nr:hypothetical protein [Ignavibacteriales bacterium]
MKIKYISNIQSAWIILFISFLITSCKDEEINNAIIKPAKRDFVWSIDSVDYGNLPSRIQLESIWGTSSKDLWGVAGNASDVRDCLWHYDGLKWSRATEGTPITEYTGNKVVYAIWGSAKNDIWTFGRKINNNILSAFIMHYDGMRWIDATPYNISSLPINLYNVYGVNKNNIWVGGYKYVLRYDGQRWKEFKLADSLIINGIAGNTKSVFLYLTSPWGDPCRFLYQFKYSDTIFTEIDYTKRSEAKFGSKPWITGNNIFTLTKGIISNSINNVGDIDTSGWRRLLTTNSYFYNNYTVSENNIFIVGQSNLLYHYNGVDWKQLSISVQYHLVDSQAWLRGVWSDGNEVFICDCNNGVMYHGR